MSQWWQRMERMWQALQVLGRAVLRLTRTHTFFHFWRLVWVSFVRNRCLVRASSLAYTTLLALIPVLAVALSVATNLIAKEGDEGREQVERLIEYVVVTVAPMLDLEVKQQSGDGEPSAETETGSEPGTEAQNEVATATTEGIEDQDGAVSRRTEVARQIHEYINRIHAKTIGVTSVLVFIFMAVLLFRSIEATFNDIWGVKKGRGWFTSLVQYWTSITLGPILLILALGVSSSTHFSRSLEWVRELGGIGTFVLFSISWLIYTFACAILYKVMPKTDVQIRSALMGGVVAGFLLQLNNKLSFLYFSNVATSDRIYGSLGAAPMFLLGLYISWTILLFGAQVAYAFQNLQSYLQEKLSDRIHQAGRELLALRLMGAICERFIGANSAPGTQDLADAMGVGSGLTAEVVEVLEDNDLINRVEGSPAQYVPARPPESITIDHVLEALRRGQGLGLDGADDTLRVPIQKAYDQVEAAAASVSREMSMADFVAQAGSDQRSSQ